MKLLGIGSTVVDKGLVDNFKPIKFKSTQGVVRDIVNKRSYGPGVVVRYETDDKSQYTDILYSLEEAENLVKV